MREKNTFKNLVITTIVILTSVFSFAMFKGVSNKVTKGYDVDEVDCERYFDLDNGYTSLFEIVDNLNNGYYDLEYKTWGTVTKFFNGANNNQNFYIQSSDKYGRIAGVLVFNSPIELSEGSFYMIIFLNFLTLILVI